MGYIRYQRVGEGGYAQTERAIQTLLKSHFPNVPLPEPLEPVRPEDSSGAVCFPTTPELHVDALGNPAPQLTEAAHLQVPEVREDGRFYLQGQWKLQGEGLTLLDEEGTICLPYHAASVNAVLAPSPDPDDPPFFGKTVPHVRVLQDDQPLAKDRYGEDIYQSESGATLRVDCAKMYALVNSPEFGIHDLQLGIHGKGLTLYAFSFGSCINPEADQPQIQKE
jgi:hypothetical protein